MAKLHVSFGEPDAGWIRVSLQHEADVIQIGASYIYSSFHSLTEALIRLKNGADEAVVVWQCEPSEYEMRFGYRDGIVDLQVLLFPGPERSIFDEPNPKLTINGTYEEVCLPFWRALRQLQGRFSEEEWQARWHGPFPCRELDLLTATLGK